MGAVPAGESAIKHEIRLVTITTVGGLVDQQLAKVPDEQRNRVAAQIVEIVNRASNQRQRTG